MILFHDYDWNILNIIGTISLFLLPFYARFSINDFVLYENFYGLIVNLILQFLNAKITFFTAIKSPFQLHRNCKFTIIYFWTIVNKTKQNTWNTTELKSIQPDLQL